MKHIIYILLVLCFFTKTFSQVAPPEAINYQAVARDNSGNILANQSVSFRISILKTSINGTLVYSETQQTTTNQYGLANLSIGTGIIVTGVFADIDWASDSYFLQTEFDPAGGSNYQLMGTSQLLSVPYALHAKTVKEHFDPKYPDGFDGETVFINGTYTVPAGKNLIINTATDVYAQTRAILFNTTPLWGDWHYIPENTTVTTNTQNNDAVTGLLFDKKTEYVQITISTNAIDYTVPAGKKLHLFLPRWVEDQPSTYTDDYIAGHFVVNGTNNIDSYANGSSLHFEDEPRLLILPEGSTIGYDSNFNPDVPAIGVRMITGYLK